MFQPSPCNYITSFNTTPLFLNLLQNQLCSEAINVGIFICELLFIQTLSPTFGLNLVQTFSTNPILHNWFSHKKSFNLTCNHATEIQLQLVAEESPTCICHQIKLLSLPLALLKCIHNQLHLNIMPVLPN